MPPKTVTTCNWVPSIVTEGTLKDFVKVGYLPEKSVMHYRAPDTGEERPLPKDGEVIVFTGHMNWGFSPPNSKFFRMFCTSSNSIRKTLDPTPYQTSVTFKFSVKYTFKKSLVSSFSGNSSI